VEIRGYEPGQAVGREKRCIGSRSFYAEDAIDNIDIPFRK
jgi:hypothetical protein